MAEPANYGTYTLASATLLTLPKWTPRGVISDPVPFNSPALAPRALATPDSGGQGTVLGIKRSFDQIANNGLLPNNAPRKILKAVLPQAPPVLVPLPPILPPPPPPPPNIASVCVMDVGAGGCNLLIDQLNEPVAYFDMGSPLNFNLASIPNTLRFTNPAWVGPIMNNAAGNLELVLSHWDWDHWRLAAIAGITAMPWTYLVAPVGFAAVAFFNALTNPQIYGGAPIAAFPNYTLYQCAPAVGGAANVLMNNNSLMMKVTTLLPLGDPIHHDVLLTADANLSSLIAFPGGAVPNLTGLNAVHHGSANDGAVAVLPPQVAGYVGQGRIAYSYGVKPLTGVHCYGHPAAAAVAAYGLAGWGTVAAQHCSTAEGPGLNAPYPPVPPATRGNISMGAIPALGAPYNGTAFALYPNNL